MRKFTFLFVFFSIIICLFVGCSKANQNSDSNSEGVVAKEDVKVSETVQVDSTKKYKESIVIGVDAQITTIDATQANSVIQNILWNCMYDTLITYNEKTGKYEPGLALSWEWKDERTLRLNLRKDVKFHNGTTFTSADVKATLDACIHGIVKGTYDHCEIIDDYTIDTVLKQTNVDWVFVLSHNASAIVAKDTIKTNNACGTGPWKVVKFNSGDSVEMERFDEYWGNLPGTKKLTLRYYGEPSARLIALENGEIDLAQAVSNADLQYAQSNPNIVVENFVSSNLIWFAFNVESEVGKDENLRKAVAYAIDRDSIVVANNGGEAAYTMWGWNSLGYTTDFTEDYSYNPEKAKEYLAKAEHNSFTCVCSAAYATVGSVLQAQLKAVGIEMKLDMRDYAGHNNATKWGSNHEATIYSIATNSSGSDMFRLIAYGTAGNRACLSDKNSPMYVLQEESAKEFDEAKRIELLKELQGYMHDNCIYYGLMYGTANICYRKGIENPGLKINKNYDYSMIQMPL